MSGEESSIFVIILYQAMFLFTGFYQTISAQYLYYQGAASGTSLLTNTAQYIGTALVGLLLIPKWWANRKGSRNMEFTMVNIGQIKATEVQKEYQLLPSGDAEDTFEDTLENTDSEFSNQKEVVNYNFIVAASLLDVTANFALTIGFFYVGSGMFQVIYSSVVIWCAILSFIFLGRKLLLVQSLCIIGVFIGLALSALGISQNEEDQHTTPPPATATGPTVLHSFNMSSTMFGMILTSFATFGYACVYVVSDQIFVVRVPNELPPSPERACFLVGSCCSCLSMLYVIFHTIPNWNSLVTEEIAKKAEHIDTFTIIIIYLVLIFASFIHNLAYYQLIKRIGNVSTGLLNSIRAIVVFGLSHTMFCEFDSGQCFNVWKGW
ncbi:92_t:CDS:2, partial [Scutellospora calospora]